MCCGHSGGCHCDSGGIHNCCLSHDVEVGVGGCHGGALLSLS